MLSEAGSFEGNSSWWPMSRIILDRCIHYGYTTMQQPQNMELKTARMHEQVEVKKSQVIAVLLGTGRAPWSMDLGKWTLLLREPRSRVTRTK
jgi:hypothetical protein